MIKLSKLFAAGRHLRPWQTVPTLPFGIFVTKAIAVIGRYFVEMKSIVS
ncbi:MAG: hypothetical protein ACFB02_13440 [Mastigocoleus sp.]